MDLYTVHTRILTPFIKETANVLGTMANLTAKAGPGYQETVTDFTFKGFVASVVVSSAKGIEGKVVMSHSNDTALAVGNNVRKLMLGADSRLTEIDEELGEALTEFSNTVIGTVANKMHKEHLMLTFGAPVYILKTTDMRYLLDGVKEIITVPLTIPNVGDFYFSYFLHNETDYIKRSAKEMEP